jgi:hypothetical protein
VQRLSAAEVKAIRDFEARDRTLMPTEASAPRPKGE